MKIWKLFKRRKEVVSPTPLRIEGIAPAPLTPEPDEAEVAAMALLESSLSPSPSPVREGRMRTPRSAREASGEIAAVTTKERYEAIAERMHEVKKEEERAAMRYVAFVEEQLKTNPHTPPVMEGSAPAQSATPGQESLPSRGDLEGSLEQGLYQHMDTVDRVGGELKRRWQHCLAEAVVRGMQNDK